MNKLSYEDYCNIVQRFEIVPVEAPPALSSKLLDEINEVFALFEHLDKPGFIGVADLQGPILQKIFCLYRTVPYVSLTARF